MTLLLVSLYEFKQFLQIVLWIAVPLTVLAVGMTIYLHYRRRKKQPDDRVSHPMDTSTWKLALAGSAEPSDPLPAAPQVLPDWLASSNPENTTLLKKYEAEVRKYREDYAILKEDYKELEYKYEDLRNKAYNGKQHNAENDKPLTDQERDKLLQQVEEMGSQHRQEKEQLLGDLAALRAAHEQLQQQFSALEQSPAIPAKNNEKPVIADAESNGIELQRIAVLEELLSKAVEENNQLKNRVNEGEYLQDLASEKKLQVEFLQQQLDQRIKTFHQLERKADEAATHLREMKDKSEKFEYRIQVLSEELTEKQLEAARVHEEATEWQATALISQQEQQLQQQKMEEKTLHVNQLEGSLRDMQQEHETLRTEIDARQQTMDTMKDDLLKEQQKAKELESKLELSSNLLVRIYSELARSLNAGWMQWQQGKEPLELATVEPAMAEQSKETA